MYSYSHNSIRLSSNLPETTQHHPMQISSDERPSPAARGVSNLSSLLAFSYWWTDASQAALVAKNPPANAGDLRDAGSIPGSGRSPGGGHGNPLQYSCLENPTDRGTWQVIAHSVAKSQTWPKQLSMYKHRHWWTTHPHTTKSKMAY